MTRATPPHDASWAEPERVTSGAPWESQVGYCRAIARGPHVWISGTAPVALDGSTSDPGDAYGQTMRCFDIIEETLHRLGGQLEDVVRTRLFVTDITRWAEIGRAHAERLGAHPPAATMVEVRRLIAPDMLVEIEVDAYVPGRRTGHGPL
ncbi:MAG: RidA family protein [Deltaproteobacteria bacterium]|nr:RidA family protein [Deltaproteobacteria bacterium]